MTIITNNKKVDKNDKNDNNDKDDKVVNTDVEKNMFMSHVIND